MQATPGSSRPRSLFFAALVSALIGFAPTLDAGQARNAPVRPVPQVAPAPQAPSAPALTDRDLAATQDQLIKLLRLSPTLTTVVEHDPTLLSNQDYVNRNNPQLGQFLAAHPEVVRNPEFYLFTHLPGDGSREEALERAVWPQLTRPYEPPSASQEIMNDLVPFLIFVGVVLALLWLTRLFLENRRWSRIFKLQTEVHNRLIDKFSSNQELLAYMESDSGRKFLEAAPISVGFEPGQRMPNAVSRVLNPLQIGVVLSLLGIGLLAIRHSLGHDMTAPMMLMGTVVLMPGLGFIVSAGMTWLLADRLGLIPDRSAPAGNSDSAYNPNEQQR